MQRRVRSRACYHLTSSMTPKALATLFVLCGVWGASFLFFKVVVEETSPLELVAGGLLFGPPAHPPHAPIPGPLRRRLPGGGALHRRPSGRPRGGLPGGRRPYRRRRPG